ncbi:MAG: hypothetical protein ACLSTO_13015 [Bilophila wadsworthia]
MREVDAGQNRVKLDMNGVTLWADAALLGPADAPQQQAKPKSGVLVRTTAGSDPEISLLRLDLRGKRADQALGELSQYLDRRCCPGARVWKSFTVAVRGPFARKCTRS